MAKPNPSAVFRMLPLALSCLLATPDNAHADIEKSVAFQIRQLQEQVLTLQQETRREVDALQRRSEQQLAQIQRQIDVLQQKGGLMPGQDHTPDLGAVSASESSVLPARAVPQSISALNTSTRLQVSGDARLRYEHNSSYDGLPSWDRGVLRGRLAASYALGDRLKLGGRLVTGDPENPRTSDTTIGDFVSDLELSLDQAFVTFGDESGYVTGGKFAKPFTSTELVWDGDVNPQGLGGRYELVDGLKGRARVSGIYFIVEQDLADEGSNMLGAQFSLMPRFGSNWELSLNAAYYDYELGARKLNVPGGARGNNVTANGRYYLSDFNLLDFVGSVRYRGLGERWPVALVADYVRNLGAEVPEDSGFGIDLIAGDLANAGHYRLRYGYSQVETDAVLGMFSNDNILYPTNYRLHSFSVDYALQEHTFLGLTSYVYRRLDPVGTVENSNDWLSRTRLNLYFTF